MAATSAEADYYHLVLDHIKKTNQEDIQSEVFNFATWETLFTDRAETLASLDPYLDESLNLITLQLGENVSNLDTFESDFEYLINYLKQASPSAKILVIGDFWERENRDEMKREAAEKCGVTYLSLSEIKEKEEYKCGVGTEVFDENGEGHIVEHGGVAAHPNDRAMKFIADLIIEHIDG